jgi:hypothetical protein
MIEPMIVYGTLGVEAASDAIDHVLIAGNRRLQVSDDRAVLIFEDLTGGPADALNIFNLCRQFDNAIPFLTRSGQLGVSLHYQRDDLQNDKVLAQVGSFLQEFQS